MESGKMNYRKVLQWIGIVIGVVITATFIAVIIFLNSFPEEAASKGNTAKKKAASPLSGKSAVNYYDYYDAVEPKKNNSPNNNEPRDPFAPPVSAWPGLLATVNFTNEPNQIKPTENKSQPETVKRTKSVLEKKKRQKDSTAQGTLPGNNPQIKSGVSPTPPNLEQQDPNSPEYKETLMLPSVSNENSATYKTTYIVKKGETLTGISQKFGVAADNIRKTNELTANDKTIEGLALIIPIPNSHLYRLKSNETLWRISMRYGVSVAILKEINNFTDSTKLIPGQIIILPVSIDKIKNTDY